MTQAEALERLLDEASDPRIEQYVSSEMVELILTIASEHLPLGEIATWLAAHTR